jgi:hypothetical protein
MTTTPVMSNFRNDISHAESTGCILTQEAESRCRALAPEWSGGFGRIQGGVQDAEHEPEALV